MSNAWAPFYFGDYIADTGHLSLAEHGAYMLLMAHYYRTGRPLPANAVQLHRVCRCMNDADRAAVDVVIAEFFTADGKVYRHNRIDAELSKAVDISEKRRAAANAKHQKSSAKPGANAPAIAEQVHTQPQPQSQIHKDLNHSKPPHSGASSRSRGSRLPDAFVVTDQHRTFAREHGLVDPDDQIDEFKDYWRAVPAPRGLKLDWDATLRNWLRKCNPKVKPISEPSRTKAHSRPVPEVRYHWALPEDTGSEEAAAIWSQALNKLSKRINPHSYDTWLRPTKGASLADGKLYVRLPAPVFTAEIYTKYRSHLEEVLPGLEVKFVSPTEIDSQVDGRKPSLPTPAPPAPQLTASATL